MKTCTKCGVCKPLEEFHRRSKNRDKRVERCKVCVCAAVKAWRDRDPEAHKARKAADRAKRRDAICADLRARYRADPDRWKRQSLQWQRDDRAKLGDAYVRTTLVQGAGLPRSAIPDELINLKREQLRLHRLAKELKQAIDERTDK